MIVAEDAVLTGFDARSVAELGVHREPEPVGVALRVDLAPPVRAHFRDRTVGAYELVDLFAVVHVHAVGGRRLVQQLAGDLRR